MGTVIPLTTHNAEIKTASVEIRSLTVTGKQVTLAVFRHLIEDELINLDGTLGGVPWGTVHYQINKNGPRVWYVWQLGTELRRAGVENARHLMFGQNTKTLNEFAECFGMGPFDPKTNGEWHEVSRLVNGEYLSRQRRAREALASLPQLFIAV